MGLVNQQTTHINVVQQSDKCRALQYPSIIYRKTMFLGDFEKVNYTKNCEVFHWIITIPLYLIQIVKITNLYFHIIGSLRVSANAKVRKHSSYFNTFQCCVLDFRWKMFVFNVSTLLNFLLTIFQVSCIFIIMYESTKYKSTRMTQNLCWYVVILLLDFR